MALETSKDGDPTGEVGTSCSAAPPPTEKVFCNAQSKSSTFSLSPLSFLYCLALLRSIYLCHLFDSTPNSVGLC